ncbi:sugar ABC transporter ATP-binding protein [Escherichia coli]|nr:sugar ABC transporter ATP-binding protein [Escherichia coli]
MSETFLQMKHITKRFPGVLALNDVQFTLRRGEVHALLGENGAGKSTLMKILSGVYQPDEGEIIFEDKPVSFSDPLSAQNVGITIIHQEFNLFPELTVEENIFIGREFCKKNRWRLDEKQQRQATIEILQKLNLAIKPDTLVADLTVAQQQMVEIAKAISVNARILIMDEPTAALTETEIESLFRVTRLLKEQGTGIVYISHRLEELALIADRATVMRDGQYISTVDYECVKISDLIAMMVGRDLGNIYPRREALQQRIPVLEVNGLTRKGVLNDINFTLYRGEILGFAGLMGAGRTELARAIFGADSIDSGTLKLNGKETVIKDISDAIQQGISYLTEDRKKEGLALNLSVERNIMLGNYPEYSDRFGNIDSRRCQQTSEEQVKALRIKTPNLEQAALNLSGGNQQKIIIARWVCKDTDILIFDEPTRGIDVVGAKLEIYELMNRLVAKGKSIIMISSELPEVLGMCDRILVMRSGRITGELSAKEATQEKIMQYATLED